MKPKEEHVGRMQERKNDTGLNRGVDEERGCFIDYENYYICICSSYTSISLFT